MDANTNANLTAAGRAAFEWGFRIGERGQHNLQAALAEYDRVMAEPPALATLNPTPTHEQSKQ